MPTRSPAPTPSSRSATRPRGWRGASSSRVGERRVRAAHRTACGPARGALRSSELRLASSQPQLCSRSGRAGSPRCRRRWCSGIASRSTRSTPYSRSQADRRRGAGCASRPICTAASLTASFASAISSVASRPDRAASRRGRAAARADSSRSFMSAMRCATAWFLPIGLPNCWRVLRVLDDLLELALHHADVGREQARSAPIASSSANSRAPCPSRPEPVRLPARGNPRGRSSRRARSSGRSCRTACPSTSPGVIALDRRRR